MKREIALYVALIFLGLAAAYLGAVLYPDGIRELGAPEYQEGQER